jgi:hypothetical protein
VEVTSPDMHSASHEESDLMEAEMRLSASCGIRGRLGREGDVDGA